MLRGYQPESLKETEISHVSDKKHVGMWMCAWQTMDDRKKIQIWSLKEEDRELRQNVIKNGW